MLDYGRNPEMDENIIEDYEEMRRRDREHTGKIGVINNSNKDKIKKQDLDKLEEDDLEIE